MKYLLKFALIANKYNRNYGSNVSTIKCFIFFALIAVNIDTNDAKVLAQNKRCADIECKAPIATGKTLLAYNADNEMSISFQPEFKVTIFGETSDHKHLDVEIDGKRGLAPKNLIREEMIIIKNPEQIVSIDVKPGKVETKSNVENQSLNSVEPNSDIPVKDSDNSSAEQSGQSSDEPIVFPSLTESSVETQTNTPIREDFTVIDGTTLYEDGYDIPLQASQTVESSPATATKTATIELNLNNVNESKTAANDELIPSSPVTDSTGKLTNKSIEAKESTITTNDSIASTEEDVVKEVTVESSDEIKVIDQRSDKTDDSNDSSTESQFESKDIKTDSETNDNKNKSEDLSTKLSEDSTQANTESMSAKNESIIEGTNGTNVFDKPIEENSENLEKPKYEEPLDNIIESANGDIKEVSNSTDSELKTEANSVENIETNDEKTSAEESPETNGEINKTEVKNKSSEETALPLNSDNIIESIEQNVEINTNSEQIFENSDKVSAEVTEIEANIVQNQTESVLNPSTDETNTRIDPIISEELKPSEELMAFNDSTNETNSNSMQTQTNETNLNTSDDRNENVIKDVNENDINLSDNYISNEINSNIEDNTSADIIVDKITEQTEEEQTQTLPDIEVKTFEETEEVFNTEVKDNLEHTEPMLESKAFFKWMGLNGMAVLDVISDLIPEEIQLILKQYQISAQAVVFTFIIAFNWCLMKIFLSVWNSKNKETELRDICCRAERKAYYFEAEKQKLQTEIEREKEKALIAEERTQSSEHKVIPLEKEFLKLKNERELLHQKVISLESELESASEARVEASRLLNDFLTSQRENVSLNSSVEALQQEMTKQKEIIAKYRSTAQQKEKENKELNEKLSKMSAELSRLKNVLKETEINLKTFQRNNDELKESKNELNCSLSQLEEEYSSLQTKADEYIERNNELSINAQKITEEIESLREQTALKDLEIESLKEILTNFRKSNNNCNEDNNQLIDENDSQMCEKSLSDLYNIVEMELKLKNITNNRNELNSKLDEVTQQCNELNNRLVSIEEDNKRLKTEREAAVEDKVKAQMELEVLSKYYKQKELEMGKEIGVQHIQRRQKEEDVDSMSSQLVAFEDENVSLRSRLQSMKREIADTERKYKNQINQLERQVHENWILARNAERKLDESKAEAAVLRQTLTMSVKSPVDGFGADASYMDDSASSVSSLHEPFGPGLPPPPPPPLPPPPPIFNPLMAGMHMPFVEESDPMAHWNPNMNPMSIGSHYQQNYNSFAPISSDVHQMANNPNLSYSSMSDTTQPISFVPSMGQHWDSNRDSYSPASQRSTSSPHSQYNMYSQPQSHYSNPMTSMSMSSPIANSMSAQFHNSMTSVTSPLVNSSPSVQPLNVLSDPIPSHWTRPNGPNGNVSNLDYSHNQYNNESEGSSRPTSRNDTNSLHTSIV